jgi:hypothetical protein
MYGHTFLRLGRKNYGSDEPLLDYTANFAAQTNTKNGLLFAIKGLAGGYPGAFSTHPYYIKVQQYNNLESRDLWEYKLNFTQEEIDRLLNHLWELGPTWMSYYFLNKNCSYQLLPVLEVARPSLNFAPHFQWRSIPLDTMRIVLEEKNLISERRFRPSHIREMRVARAALSPDDLKLAEDLAKHSGAEERLQTLPADRQRRVLESAYRYWRYKNGFERDLPENVRAKERELLLLRNALPAESSGAAKVVIPVPPAPETAHGTGRISLGFGADRTTTFQEFFIRPALHDIEEDPTGFVDGSELEMFSVKFRYNDDRKNLYLENGTLIDIVSLSPLDPWLYSPSWRVRAELKPVKDLDKNPDTTFSAGVNGGSGFKVGPFYSLVELDSALGSVFQDGYRVGGGLSGGLLFYYGRGWVTHLNAAALRYPVGNVSNTVRFRASQTVRLSKLWMARAVWERQNHYQEGIFSLNRYF